MAEIVASTDSGTQTQALPEAQYFEYLNVGGYTCWAKVNGPGRVWDGRDEGEYWQIGPPKQVDLIRDAGFQPGDTVTAGNDVLGGDGANNEQQYTVASGRMSAFFTASGTVQDASLLLGGGPESEKLQA